MGNSASSSSKGPHDETVDYGYLTPYGVYSGTRDWNESVVGRLIVDRKLAPFYRPLEDYDESWDDEKILAARKEPPSPSTADGESSHGSRGDHASISSRYSHHHKRSATVKDPTVNPEAAIYRGAVECPICFLVRAHCYHRRLRHFSRLLLSTTHQTSIARDVATRLYAQSALFK